MKPNPSLDELLCSFMDGELSPRQRTEVQRMANRDPQVAQRLRQLQGCRTLLCSLPQAQAPADLLDQVRGALERRTLLAEQPAFARRSLGSWHLAFRKLATAAAMFALLGVLGVVVYQIVAPVSDSGSVPPVAEGSRSPEMRGRPTAVPVVTVADAGFSGRLELQTAALMQADALLKRAIEENGLSSRVEIDTAGGKRVYQLVSTREGINHVVASLSGIWQTFHSTTLRVDRPGNDMTPVVLGAVTPEQAVSIIACNSTEASVAAAESYAVINGMAQSSPGHSILAAIDDDAGVGATLLTVPKPIEASNDKNAQTTLAPPQGQSEASLTIVLLDIR
jgi:hypothetical protein